MRKTNNFIKNTNILKSGSKNLNVENWKVYHPNGKHMFTCGETKATWYLSKDLATVIGKYKIQFTFDPSGYGFDDDELFGRTARETICVVNGTDVGLQRHHIVPYCYRSYFPDEFKTKNHHDVVLINYGEHGRYEKIATDFKNDIAEIYGVKTINEYNKSYTDKLRNIDRDYIVAYTTIKSILSSHGNLTSNIINERFNTISKNTGISIKLIKNFSYVQLYKLMMYLVDVRNNDVIEFKKKYRKQYDHGYHVVKKLNTEDKIMEFVKLWREHFINTMNPKYMPVGWSIDFRVKTNIRENK